MSFLAPAPRHYLSIFSPEALANAGMGSATNRTMGELRWQRTGMSANLSINNRKLRTDLCLSALRGLGEVLSSSSKLACAQRLPRGVLRIVFAGRHRNLAPSIHPDGMPAPMAGEVQRGLLRALQDRGKRGVAKLGIEGPRASAPRLVTAVQLGKAREDVLTFLDIHGNFSTPI